MDGATRPYRPRGLGPQGLYALGLPFIWVCSALLYRPVGPIMPCIGPLWGPITLHNTPTGPYNTCKYTQNYPKIC